MSRTAVLARVADACRLTDASLRTSIPVDELLHGGPFLGRPARLGGLAGLTGAYRLQKAGVAATVHEASGHLRGRCRPNP